MHNRNDGDAHAYLFSDAGAGPLGIFFVGMTTMWQLSIEFVQVLRPHASAVYKPLEELLGL